MMHKVLELKKTMNKFHEHLDKCKQCRNKPFELCPIGSVVFIEVMKSLGLDIPK